MTKRKISRSPQKCEQIKIFARMGLDYLEADVNKWLREHAGTVEVISRGFFEMERGFRVELWYRIEK